MNPHDEIRLLWMDDEIHNFVAYVGMLEDLGFVIDTAVSYMEGMYFTHVNEYDLIIVDILMPPPNGIDFLLRIEAEQEKAVFIIFSGYLHNSNYRKRLSKLTKPYLSFEKCFDKPPSSPVIADQFIKPLLQSLKHRASKQTALERIISAIEVKPGWAGVSINLKELILKEKT